MEKSGCRNNCTIASFVSEYVTKKAEEDLSGVMGIYLIKGAVLSINNKDFEDNPRLFEGIINTSLCEL